MATGLERLDPLGDRRLGEAEPAGGRLEAPLLQDGRKRGKLGVEHAHLTASASDKLIVPQEL